MYHLLRNSRKSFLKKNVHLVDMIIQIIKKNSYRHYVNNKNNSGYQVVLKVEIKNRNMVHQVRQIRLILEIT